MDFLRNSMYASRGVIIGVLSMIVLLQCTYGQSAITAKFSARSHTYNGRTLPFRLFVPDNYSATQRYPVVLALHGSGERGSDNNAPVENNGLATSWAAPANQALYPCFVVVPQCPSKGSWSSGSSFLTAELETANNILDTLAKEFAIDTDRMYVTGLSLGGYGTWELIKQYPDRFAAAVPMSAGLNPVYAKNILSVPIWNFHGTADDVVSVQQSRLIINALQALGRTAVYTHSRNGDTSRMPDSLIVNEIRNRADLLYTEYINGGHVIWVESYNYPPLFQWVFDKARLNSTAISLSTLKSRRTLKGTEAITWTTTQTGGSVELWFSGDAGGTWTMLVADAPNTGAFQWNTTGVADCSFGQLKVFLKDASGRVYGSDVSSFFTVKNTSNGPPFAAFVNEAATLGVRPEKDSVELSYYLGDPEWAPLSVGISYSADGGTTFTQVAVFTAASDTSVQTRRLALGRLPNSAHAIMKITVSDGASQSSVSSRQFVKMTPRMPGPWAQHIAGGGGKVWVKIVDPAALTGHRYRMTFTVPPAGAKSYTVRDIDANADVATQTGSMDGFTEGPQFGGLALVVRDYADVAADTDSSRWVKGAATMPASVFLPEFLIGTETVKGVPMPYDYSITLASVVVDTSESLYGAAAVPMKFSVRNLTLNRRAGIIFDDADGNNTVSSLDGIYILEPGAGAASQLTWAVQFVADPKTVFPVPGDEYVLRTLKPITAADVFTFSGLATSVRGVRTADAFRLDQNFPNPFNPATTIGYTLPHRGRVTLGVYDLLGRRVALLVDEVREAGAHSVSFNAQAFASGVYIYRLRSGQYTQTRRLLLLR